MGTEEFIQVGVRTSMEDWILDDIHGICQFLKQKEVPTSFKCKDGYGKMPELYGKAPDGFMASNLTSSAMSIYTF